MNVNVYLVDLKGNRTQINIDLSDTIGNKKKELNQSESHWKYDGMILRDDRTFASYQIEDNDTIVSVNRIF